MNDDPFARAVEKAEAVEQERRQAGRRRHKKRVAKGNRTALRIHATVFAAVNVFLIAIWVSIWQFEDGTGYPWFIWVLFGWGIGLAAHWAAVRDHIRE